MEILLLLVINLTKLTMHHWVPLNQLMLEEGLMLVVYIAVMKHFFKLEPMGVNLCLLPSQVMIY